MKGISEKEYSFRLKQIQKENQAKERARKLKEEKRKGRKKLKLPSTSKLILLGMILLCVQIVLFCEYAMMKLYDASSLYVLVGIPAALAPIIWGYYSKAKAENTAGGLIYDIAMAEMQNNNEEEIYDEATDEDGAVG